MKKSLPLAPEVASWVLHLNRSAVGTHFRFTRGESLQL